MKPNTDTDPLDQQLDSLLASRPIKASDDFTARVMAATEADTARRSTIRKVIPFALPIAAAIAIALTWASMQGSKENPANVPMLSAADAEEIFMLEDGLAVFAETGDDVVSSGSLLATLDALYLEI